MEPIWAHYLANKIHCQVLMKIFRGKLPFLAIDREKANPNFLLRSSRRAEQQTPKLEESIPNVIHIPTLSGTFIQHQTSLH